MIVEGKRIGLTMGVEYSADLTKMDGLFVNCGLRGTRLIRTDDIQVMGEVSVIARGTGRRAAMTRAMPRRAASVDGTLRGAAKSALIDEETGDVSALLLTFGYIDDILYGSRWIREYRVSGEMGEVLFMKGGETR